MTHWVRSEYATNGNDASPKFTVFMFQSPVSGSPDRRLQTETEATRIFYFDNLAISDL